jgi:molybdate transport system substrate-binding protein
MRRLLLIVFGVLLPAFVARAQPATVFAAASLTDAMQSVAAAWAKQGHPAPRLSFASSSTLARQIEAGAPANIFASADEKWMNYLADRRAIVAETRKDVLANRLVLVVPSSNPVRVTIAPGFGLASLLGPNGRLAVGDPAHVPAGIYAKQALTKLGVWAVAAPRLAPAEDVRAALLLVERGEAAAGIVYATDANATRSVRIAGFFPADSHDPIRYPFAIVRAGDTPEARALLAFIEGPEGLALFAKSGFGTE